MTELAKIDAMAVLTDQQRRFVEALVKTGDEDASLKQAGYGETVHPSQILASPRVTAAIWASCEAQLNGRLKLKAVRTLEKLMDSGPAATQFNAAKLVLEHNRKADADGDKPMTEMSIDELERLIERKEAELKNVTPSNGA